MLNRKLLLASFFVCLSLTSYPQFYPISIIPDSLKTNAVLVVRFATREVEMNSINSGSEKITRILTVFNKRGEDQAVLRLYYDKNSSVKINEIIYYDANGKLIRNVKQSEITDSPVYGSSLYSETRMKSYMPAQPAFPYTIKYTYETDLNNIISFAVWYPVWNYNIAVQSSVFTVRHPGNIKINEKEIRIKKVKSARNNDAIERIWEINSVKAIEREPYDAGLMERIPSVLITPAELSYDSFRGQADTWRDYGNWFNTLYEGRDILAEEERQMIQKLSEETPDTLEKVRQLYKYMQNRTRYVNITLGIGGYQPFDAKTVYETGYGDCKALSNYMFSLLKSIGIKSFTAIVSSGSYKEAIFHDFPNFQQFDHAILCVPYKHDTIWLECTDQRIPFGFLGNFTDDRDVLLITEQGGKFAHTRKYGIEENIKSCKSVFIVDSTGSAEVSISDDYSGLQYDNITDLIYSDYDSQKKWLYEHSPLPSHQIKSFSINHLNGKNPGVRINESAVSKNYCSFSGKYMLLPLNVLNIQSPARKMLGKRESDILISRSYVDYDTIIYKIPKSYTYESIPSGGEINSKFGSYKWSVTAKANEIIYTRKFTILEGHYMPSTYKELYDFILMVSKADNSKILLTPGHSGSLARE